MSDKTEIRNADLIEIHAGVRLNFKSNCKMPNKLIAVNVFKSSRICCHHSAEQNSLQFLINFDNKFRWPGKTMYGLFPTFGLTV